MGTPPWNWRNEMGVGFQNGRHFLLNFRNSLKAVLVFDRCGYAEVPRKRGSLTSSL